MLSSFFPSVSTHVVVVRFDTSKVCLWEIIVTPQLLVILCCDVNNECCGTKDVLLIYGYGRFGWTCFYTQTRPLPVMIV